MVKAAKCSTATGRRRLTPSALQSLQQGVGAIGQSPFSLNPPDSEHKHDPDTAQGKNLILFLCIGISINKTEKTSAAHASGDIVNQCRHSK